MSSKEMSKFRTELQPIKQELAELKQEASEIYRALYRLIEQLKYMRWDMRFFPKEFAGFDTVFQSKPKLKKRMRPKKKTRR